MSLISIFLPKLGESVAEATIIKWLKEEGDMVAIDETIAEVATDKVDTDLPSEYEGILKQILVAEGDVAQVGAAIAIIETSGAGIQKIAKKVTAPVAPITIEEDSSEKEVIAQPQSIVASTNQASHSKSSNYKSDDKSGLFLTPVVRNIAREAGLTPEDLTKIKPTGSNDTRITKKDILNFLSPVKEIVASPSKRIALHKSPNDETIPLNRMRKLIAQHMATSVQTAAHVTSWVITDVSTIVTWREKEKAAFFETHNTKLTYTHVFMSLVVECLRQYPKLNAWFDGEEELLIKGDINLGFAAATPDDNLIVPNLKSAQTMSLVEIVKGVNTLGQSAKTKKLQSNDIEHTTFTVSNTGIFGSMMGTPILALPQVAILALGEIASAPGIITKDGIESIGIIKQMHLSLSYDHRVIDGAYASKFLKDLQSRIAGFDGMKY